MSAAAAAPAAPLIADASHAFAAAGVDRHTARIGAVIDPVFLVEAGWDATRLVLCPPSEHALLGRPVCLAAGCSTTAPDRSRICASCRRRLAEHGLSQVEIAALPARPQPNGGSELSPPGSASRDCAVAACTRPRRHRNSVYCEAHQQRLRAAQRPRPGLGEPRWQRTKPAIGRGGEVGLPGLPTWVVAEMLFGLQQRCRVNAVKTDEAVLRALCDDLRRQQVGSLVDYAIADGRDLEFKGLSNCLTGHARRALATPEIEVVNDEWDLVCVRALRDRVVREDHPGVVAGGRQAVGLGEDFAIHSATSRSSTEQGGTVTGIPQPQRHAPGRPKPLTSIEKPGAVAAHRP